MLAAVWATGSIALAGNGIRQVDVPAEAYAWNGGDTEKIEDPRLKRLFLLAEIDNFTEDERKQYYSQSVL